MVKTLNNDVLKGNLSAKTWIYKIQWNEMGNSIPEFIWLSNTYQHLFELDKRLFYSKHLDTKVLKDQKIRFISKWEFYTDENWNTEFSLEEIKNKWISVNLKNHLIGIFNENLVDISFSSSSTENINNLIRECRWTKVELKTDWYITSHWPIFILDYKKLKNNSNQNIMLDEETIVSWFEKVISYLSNENAIFKRKEEKRVKVTPKVENIHNIFEKMKEEEWL